MEKREEKEREKEKERKEGRKDLKDLGDQRDKNHPQSRAMVHVKSDQLFVRLNCFGSGNI